jgi:hypothetical protein
MAARDAGRFLARRALTTSCYALAVIGITNWDSDPDSWRLIAFRLATAVMFLWWAVSRTIRHYHEDQELRGSSGSTQHRHGGPGPFYPDCPVCNPKPTGSGGI